MFFERRMGMIHLSKKKPLTTALIPSAIARYTSVTMNIASSLENDLWIPGSNEQKNKEKSRGVFLIERKKKNLARRE